MNGKKRKGKKLVLDSGKISYCLKLTLTSHYFIQQQKNFLTSFDYDPILLLHLFINCAYIFCTFIRCTRIGFFNSNILENNKSAFLLIYFLYKKGVSLIVESEGSND